MKSSIIRCIRQAISRIKLSSFTKILLFWQKNFFFALQWVLGSTGAYCCLSLPIMMVNSSGRRDSVWWKRTAVKMDKKSWGLPWIKDGFLKILKMSNSETVYVSCILRHRMQLFLCFFLWVFPFRYSKYFPTQVPVAWSARLLETSRQRALSATGTMKRDTISLLIRDQVARHACTWFNICHPKPNPTCDHGPLPALLPIRLS